MSSKFDVDSKKVKITIIVSVIMIIIMFAFNIFGKENKYEIGEGLETQEAESADLNNNDIFEEENENDTYVSEIKEEFIFVDIIGEVEKPSLVEVKEGDRLSVAIEKAGGLTENANRESINLAQKLVDGAQYIVPSKGEALVINYCEDTENHDNKQLDKAKSQENSKLNINTASKEELQELTGIGEVLSQRIIDYRTENGEFSSIEDIRNVKGIGDKKYQDINSQICVN